jgi:hypothetical protein
MDIPANYTPRPYQLPFLSNMDDSAKFNRKGKQRGLIVWHRRSGKTKTIFNFEIKKAHERKGQYFHCFPEYNQGRKILWDGIDNDRVLDMHCPAELRKSVNKQEMKIELTCGSSWQIIGADNYDSLVGSNPVGIVFDEYSISEKMKKAWDYFRPILVENGGWAVFCFTPRGRNHGWDLYQMASRNPEWFCQLLTVDDTKALSIADIQKEREAGMSEEMIRQEFYCDFITSMGDIVIPFRYIQESIDRNVNYNHAGRVAGLDVARFGNDRTAIVVRQGGSVTYVETWQGHDTVQTVGKVRALFDAKMFDVVAVDTIGVGAGVFDMLKNIGAFPVVSVNVAEATTENGRFRRMRDELWWKAREWFMEETCTLSALTDSMRKELIGDIQDIHFKYSPTGQIVVEDKDEMKKRLEFSPDTGDAFCCTLSPKVEHKIKQADRELFASHTEMFNDYNPLTFGLEVS